MFPSIGIDNPHDRLSALGGRIMDDDWGVSVGERASFLTSGRTIDASLGGSGNGGAIRDRTGLVDLWWEGMELAKLLRATNSRHFPKTTGF